MIDTTKASLDDFIELLLGDQKGKYYPCYHFPTDQHLDDFLKKIETHSKPEIKGILRSFLISNCTFPQDLVYRKVAYVSSH